MRRLIIALVCLFVAGCSGSSPGSKAVQQNAHQAAQDSVPVGSYDHCLKVVGAYVFRIEQKPFTAAWRQQINISCRAAQPNDEAVVVGQVAVDAGE